MEAWETNEVERQDAATDIVNPGVIVDSHSPLPHRLVTSTCRREDRLSRFLAVRYVITSLRRYRQCVDRHACLNTSFSLYCPELLSSCLSLSLSASLSLHVFVTCGSDIPVGAS